MPDVLLLLEHDPVYTRGRRTAAGDLPMGEDWYRAQGFEVEDTDRGGKVTYHGPGQLVGYPIMGITDVVAHVRMIEQAMVAALAEEGVEAGVREGLTGVWAGERKIGSIGLHVQRGRHDPRLLGQRRWRSPAVGVDRAVRNRGRSHHLDPAGDRGGLHELLPEARRLPVRRGVRASAEHRVAGPRPDCMRRAGAGGLMSTRSRANPGGVRVLALGETQPFRARKPPWFKVPAPGGTRYRELKGLIDGEGLHTVCQEAACPNIGECWERGTATFMILGRHLHAPLRLLQRQDRKADA